MKYFYLTFLTLILAYSHSFGQWSTGTNIYNTNSGNVGIGTGSNTPVDKLHVQGGSVFVQTVRTGTNSEFPLVYGTQAVKGASAGNAGLYLFENGSGGYGQASGLAFNTSLNDASAVTRMLLTAGGNLCLGTTYPLEYNNFSTLTLDNSTGGVVAFRQNGSLQGQIWNDGSNLNLLGNSGIGLVFQTDGNTKAVLLPNGNFGLGTTAPGQKLSIFGSGAVENVTNGSDQDLVFTITAPGATDKNTLISPSTSTNLAFGIGSTEKMRINSSGNLVIGSKTQNNSAYKLDVYGSARANAIIVNGTGADFVFKSTYRLLPLDDLKKYVDKNHHLPEIASAKEMQTNGLDLGDNQTKLLQKVEELTLYLFQKDAQIKTQQLQITKQQQDLDELKKQFAVLKKRK